MSSAGDNLEADDDEEVAAVLCCCASCGIAEVDDIKLKKCDGCDLVRYCSDVCQEDHRPEHEASCKERAAELRDEVLFRQPEGSHQGDCPLCCVPLPFEKGKSLFYQCCSKVICKGCLYAYLLQKREDLLQKREANVQLGVTCPFCRHPVTTKEEANKIMMKRVAANDPVALRQVGVDHFDEGDYDNAFSYWAKAAELGDAMAHYNLSHLYRDGLGVEKDETKEIYHLEEAAIAGHPRARNNLGCYDWNNGRIDRAVKHFSIAANLGNDKSLQALKEYYKDGLVSKEDFAAALRGHYAAIDATKSPQRREMAEILR